MPKKSDETTSKKGYFCVEKPKDNRPSDKEGGIAKGEWKDANRAHYQSLPNTKAKDKHKKGGVKTHEDGF